MKQSQQQSQTQYEQSQCIANQFERFKSQIPNNYVTCRTAASKLTRGQKNSNATLRVIFKQCAGVPTEFSKKKNNDKTFQNYKLAKEAQKSEKS